MLKKESRKNSILVFTAKMLGKMVLAAAAAWHMRHEEVPFAVDAHRRQLFLETVLTRRSAADNPPAPQSLQAPPPPPPDTTTATTNDAIITANASTR